MTNVLAWIGRPWNIGPGNDPFGGPTREPIPMLDRLPILAEAGMSYYEAHDVEITAEMAPAAAKLARKLGLKCAMYTPSFFAAPNSSEPSRFRD